MKPTKNRPGRSITDHDWRRISAALHDWQRVSTIGARTRALIYLCRSTGLRLSEALALDLDQILERPGKIEIRSACFLQREQSKGKRRGKRFTIPARAKTAIRDYLRAALAAGAIESADNKGTAPRPRKRQPLFISLKTTGKGKASARLSPRMAQISFHAAQRKAGIGTRDQYRFHDLRHTYATAIAAASGGDVFTVAAAARLDSINNTLRYVHDNYQRTAAIIERAAQDL